MKFWPDKFINTLLLSNLKPDTRLALALKSTLNEVDLLSRSRTQQNSLRILKPASIQHQSLPNSLQIVLVRENLETENISLLDSQSPRQSMAAGGDTQSS
ncbi:hypothetical protein RchiOBHm_Chr2g0168931 [Rosa chinensis]|uniref:Uncharacterized protein n=1 Tax=Rosa chinensis TaxID=74649 RepID=A0A2P6S4R0_ROSCH|nr:hypothetical protein RchiOBHm_Chr2g0168931 [Rosa chinensis]